MRENQINQRAIFISIAFIALVSAVIFLTYNRAIKQDDGWYASYVMRWMQHTGHNEIKSYWDYTDTNDLDIGCSFVFTLIEGIFFSLFGISAVTMKAFNSFEAVMLCCMLYIYVKREGMIPAVLLVASLVGWNYFHMHFFNRPELPAAAIAVLILYLLSYYHAYRWLVFAAFMLMPILMDIHPLSLFMIASIALQTFIKKKNKRWYCIAGGLAGLILYFTGNYWINHSFGIFTTLITGQKVALGDHYAPVFSTGFNDMWHIAKERFNFITKTVGISGTIKTATFAIVAGTAIYLAYKKKLKKNRLLSNSIRGYVLFIVLSTLFSEATSNGFRLYHSIMFGLLYFSLLLTIYKSIERKQLAYLGLLPFLIFAKDAIPKIREIHNYFKQYGFYNNFEAFNNLLPENGKALMRPTHAIFNYTKAIHFDYTYGLLRYMQKTGLSFKDAIIKKHYDYLALDEQFEQEFFTDISSSYRTDPNPYYVPLQQTGLRSTEFKELVAAGFLQPVSDLNDLFAGKTVLYKINYSLPK